MLLSSAETGEPVAFLADAGHLTDVRTAAVSALVARELGRRDRVLGILGTGIQARLQARMHAEILDLRQIYIWGRNPERAAECRRDLQAALPARRNRARRFARRGRPRGAPDRHRDRVAPAAAARLAISSPAPTSPPSAPTPPGKQELDPEILRRASLLLVDSRRQCEKLGELQHAPGSGGPRRRDRRVLRCTRSPSIPRPSPWRISPASAWKTCTSPNTVTWGHFEDRTIRNGAHAVDVGEPRRNGPQRKRRAPRHPARTRRDGAGPRLPFSTCRWATANPTAPSRCARN